MTTNIELADGFIRLTPDFPDELKNELRYYHRELVQQGYKRVSTGQYRDLYSIQQSINNATNTAYRHLITLPGFASRLKNWFTKRNLPYTIVDKRTPMPQVDVVKAMEGLYDYQYEPVYKLLMSGGGIAACPTGFGKTHLMGGICKGYSHQSLCERDTPIIAVCAPDRDIVEKNYEDLCNILPDRDIGLCMSGRKKIMVEDIMVITTDSLHLLDTESVGVLISDEVHASVSTKRADTIMSFTKAARFGFSATPTGRFDGRDVVTEGMFGPAVFTCSYADGVKLGALVPIRVFWINVPIEDMRLQLLGKISQRGACYRRGVYDNPDMQELVRKLMTESPESMQTLCILQHIEQMDKLLNVCKDIPYVHACTDASKLTKRTNVEPINNKQRKSIYNQVKEGEIRKILSTWIYKQGVNFPELSLILNAGGGGSDIAARQIPGRESRAIEGKHESYLIDFWHPWDVRVDKDGKKKPGHILRDDKSREKAYTDLGFDQQWIDSVDELPWMNNDVNG